MPLERKNERIRPKMRIFSKKMKKNDNFLDSYPGSCIIFAENFLFRITNTQTITTKTRHNNSKNNKL